MKVLFLVGILFLAGCSKQDDSKQMTSFEKANEEFNVKKTLSSMEQIQKRAGTYTEDDPAVRLNAFEMLAILQSLYPQFALESMAEKQKLQMTVSDTGKVKPFLAFHDWVSIKTSYTEPNQKLDYVMIELYDKESYQIAKQNTFDMCKNIWKHIDARIPSVIDELSNRIENYEKNNSSAMTSYIRYGYLFSIDASHYKDGYPIVCTIRYDKS